MVYAHEEILRIVKNKDYFILSSTDTRLSINVLLNESSFRIISYFSSMKFYIQREFVCYKGNLGIRNRGGNKTRRPPGLKILTTRLGMDLREKSVETTQKVR